LNCDHEYIDSKGFCVHCGLAFPVKKVMPWTWGQTPDGPPDAPNINFDWQGGCFLTEGWGLVLLILVWVVLFGFMILTYIGHR
jgi:hypothetical protein